MVGVYDGGGDSGGLVPAAHVQQNGVAVGKWACFWVSAASPSFLPRPSCLVLFFFLFLFFFFVCGRRKATFL
jgi:hypothetical protein